MRARAHAMVRDYELVRVADLVYGTGLCPGAQSIWQPDPALRELSLPTRPAVIMSDSTQIFKVLVCLVYTRGANLAPAAVAPR